MRRQTRFIVDISKTLVTTTILDDENRDPYEEALEQVNQRMFGGNVPLSMSMAEDGQLFPDHITDVLKSQEMDVETNLTVRDLQDALFCVMARYAISRIIEPYLVDLFSVRDVLAVEGLDRFMAGLEGQHGIITGDLRAVAQKLLTNNTYGDLTEHFPPHLWCCGDDEGLVARGDQIHRVYQALDPDPQERLVLVDDAKNGISAMRWFVDLNTDCESLVVGVLTGNYDADTLFRAGADRVVEHIGHVHSLLD